MVNDALSHISKEKQNKNMAESYLHLNLNQLRGLTFELNLRS